MESHFRSPVGSCLSGQGDGRLLGVKVAHRLLGYIAQRYNTFIEGNIFFGSFIKLRFALNKHLEEIIQHEGTQHIAGGQLNERTASIEEGINVLPFECILEILENAAVSTSAAK